VCFIAALPALAQTSTAELSGNVTDSTGAVIANAKVIAANSETGTSREVTTNQAGFTTSPYCRPEITT